jgi:hypothetical protein
MRGGRGVVGRGDHGRLARRIPAWLDFDPRQVSVGTVKNRVPTKRDRAIDVIDAFAEKNFPMAVDHGLQIGPRHIARHDPGVEGVKRVDVVHRRQ